MVDVAVKYTGQAFDRLYDDQNSSRFHTTVSPLLGGVPAQHQTHSTPTWPSECWFFDFDGPALRNRGVKGTLGSFAVQQCEQLDALVT